MDLLSATTACVIFVTPQIPCDVHTPVPAIAAHVETAQHIAQWDGFITEAAQRFAVPEDWIRGVIGAESGGRAMLNGLPITSPKGAMGLMQLMPETWQEMRLRYGLGDDPYDPHDNILAGTAYLRRLLDRFGTGAFAAYNAGPGRFAAYLDGLQSLPAETQKYLLYIKTGVPEVAVSAPNETLFFKNSAPSKMSPVALDSKNSHVIAIVNSHDLFVPLSGSTPD